MEILSPSETTSISKIGIMGGTFDPIHIGHLFIAEETLERLGLDKILFIPAGVSPHKLNNNTTDPQHRFIMTAIAVNSNENFYLSSIEIDRKGPSYTIDTMKTIKELLPPNIELYFITGGDTFIDLETWKDYEMLLEQINFVVFTRAGFDNELLDRKIKLFKDKYNGKISKISIPLLEVSSTDIRERVRQNRTIKYLIPEAVEDYIKKHKLYQNTR